MAEGAPTGSRLHRAARALARSGFDVVSVEPLFGDDPLSEPRAFVGISPTGDRIKVRLHATGRAAQRQVQLTQAIDDPRLPVPLARDGAAVVEPWIDGTVVGRAGATEDVLDAAGALLAALHGWRGVVGETLPQRRRTDPVVAAGLRQVDALRRRQIVTRRDATAVGRALEGLPAVARWGIQHTDLCGENLVIRPDGVLVTIDNEHLGRGFQDHDLARSWVRWALPGRSWRRFEQTYAAALDVPLEDGRPWRVAAAVLSLTVRMHLGGRLDAPRQALASALSPGT